MSATVGSPSSAEISPKKLPFFSVASSVLVEDDADLAVDDDVQARVGLAPSHDPLRPRRRRPPAAPSTSIGRAVPLEVGEERQPRDALEQGDVGRHRPRTLLGAPNRTKHGAVSALIGTAERKKECGGGRDVDRDATDGGVQNASTNDSARRSEARWRQQSLSATARTAVRRRAASGSTATGGRRTTSPSARSTCSTTRCSSSR